MSQKDFHHISEHAPTNIQSMPPLTLGNRERNGITREYIDQMISFDMHHANRMALPFDHFDHDDGRNDELVR